MDCFDADTQQILHPAEKEALRLKNGYVGVEQLHYSVEYMGDRSPRETHKKDIQKHARTDAGVRSKLENAEAQHHPTSGHAATPSHPTTSDQPGERKYDQRSHLSRKSFNQWFPGEPFFEARKEILNGKRLDEYVNGIRRCISVSGVMG
jgi:hypothetical protein